MAAGQSCVKVSVGICEGSAHQELCTVGIEHTVTNSPILYKVWDFIEGKISSQGRAFWTSATDRPCEYNQCRGYVLIEANVLSGNLWDCC